MSTNEWLPAQIPFDLVRRGFAPDQVTAHLERLEYDLRIATANSDATNQRLSEVSAQLESAQAQADELRAQLDNMAREPVSMTGLSNRMQRMIRLAEEEAAEIRARANTDADKVRASAAEITAMTAAERDAFDAERERTRRQLADQVRDLLAEATTEAEQTRTSARQESQAALASATAEAERLVTEAAAESRATLTAAREEALATLTAARTEAEQTLTSARTEAADTLGSARDEAERLTATSKAERERLDAESAARRAAVEEDFEIAISSRRAEAHQRLTEREELSVADAKQRIADATAESQRLVAEATAHSAELVRRAAAQAHQRVAEADHAVGELTNLRGHVLDQLASLREHLSQVDKLAASGPALLDPPAAEAGRPVTADFPADPDERPTGLPSGYDEEPGPWDEVTVESLRAEQPKVTAGSPSADPAQSEGGSNAGSVAESTDDKLNAIAADFDRDEPIDRTIADGDTDTFPRLERADADSDDDQNAQPQRSGLRAFADRAMGR